MNGIEEIRRVEGFWSKNKHYLSQDFVSRRRFKKEEVEVHVYPFGCLGSNNRKVYYLPTCINHRKVNIIKAPVYGSSPLSYEEYYKEFVRKISNI